MNSDCIEKTNNQTKQKQTKITKQNKKTKKQIQNRKNPKSQKQVMFNKIQSAKKIMIIKHAYIYFFVKKKLRIKLLNEYMYVYSKLIILLCFILILLVIHNLFIPPKRRLAWI